MQRLIDADALQIKIASLSKLARSDAQKSLLGRVLYIIDQMPTITMPQMRREDGRRGRRWNITKVLVRIANGAMRSGKGLVVTC